MITYAYKEKIKGFSSIGIFLLQMAPDCLSSFNRVGLSYMACYNLPRTYKG